MVLAAAIVAALSVRALVPAAVPAASLVAAKCAACHGAKGAGSATAPRLKTLEDRRSVAAAIVWIKSPQPPMPELYPKPPSESDVNDLVVYLESLKRARRIRRQEAVDVRAVRPRMNRRQAIVGTSAALLATAAAARADVLPLGPLPGSRYPDPRVEALDKRFKYAIGDAAIERIASGLRFAEGPVYFRDTRCLIWSDIPNNRLMRWDEDDGHVSVFRAPANYTNGNTRDRQGRLVSCEQASRRITRTEYDGRITVLVDRYNGKRFNAPNDLVVASDDAVWFSDPYDGLANNYNGRKAVPELPHNVYRFDPHTGKIAVVADDFDGPNGLCFSPDEKRLYIIDSGFVDGTGRSNIRMFDVAGGKLRNGKIFAENFAPGSSDGMRVDMDGNIWCSMGWADAKEDGIRCYAPTGDLIGKIHLPETPANLCFGGVDKNRLFIAASTSVYALYVDAAGAQTP